MRQEQTLNEPKARSAQLFGRLLAQTEPRRAKRSGFPQPEKPLYVPRGTPVPMQPLDIFIR